MSGRVPPSSRAVGRVIRNPSQSDIERGKALYESFSGQEAEVIGKANVEVSQVGVVIGTLDAVLYTTVRDGQTEKYVHHFRAKDKPLLVVSPDGSQMYILGGNYDFTERGIVDGSDAKTRRELGLEFDSNPRRR